MNSLPYILSTEDAAIFKQLQASAFIADLATPGEGELVALHKTAKKERMRCQLNAAADYLKQHILAGLLYQKESILEQLKKDPACQMTAEVFTWYTIRHHISLTELKRRKDKMTEEAYMDWFQKNNLRQQDINFNGYQTEIYVQSAPEEGDARGFTRSLWPTKIEDIFKYTDVAERISLAFGPCFYPSTSWEMIEGLGEHGDFGYSVFKRTLCLQYFPFGLDKRRMMKLLDAAKRQAEREREGIVYQLSAKDEVCMTAKPTLPPPQPLSPPASPCFSHGCFCGCEDDE